MSDAPSDNRNALFERLRHEGTTEKTPSAAAGIGYGTDPVAIRVNLAHSIRSEEAEIVSVDLRPPTYADVTAAMNGEISQAEMFARMAGLTMEVFQALRWPDAEKLIVAARTLAPEMKGI